MKLYNSNNKKLSLEIKFKIIWKSYINKLKK